MQTGRMLATILILVSCSVAQQPGTCRFSIPVSVSDAKTLEPVSGLSVDSFSLRVGKEEIRPVAVNNLAAKRVFLFVDASGSILTNRARWIVVSQAVEELLSAVDKKTPVITEVFAESSRSFRNRNQVPPYLYELARLENTKSPVGKMTRLYDAVTSAVESERLGIDDAVLVFTDGGENKSTVNKSGLIRELRNHSIRLSIIIPEDIPETIEEDKGRRDLAEIADETGGLLLELRTPDRKKPGRILPPTLYSEMLYRVEFVAAESRERLRVLLPSSKKHSARTLKVRAMKRLPDCPAK